MPNHNIQLESSAVSCSDNASSTSMRTPSMARRILQLLAHLSEETALNGREIARKLSITSEDVQKTLPFLAKRHRVTRAKRPDLRRGQYYYYWMSCAQKRHFRQMLRLERASDSERLRHENQRLRLHSAQLEQALRQIRSHGGTTLEHCSAAGHQPIDI
jgi:DNA-binding MarR family transcriptional regulator